MQLNAAKAAAILGNRESETVMRVGYRVPATSANLGPGFDSFGIALKLYNMFEAELADEWKVEVEGEGVDYLATDGTNLVATAMRTVFEEYGHPELRALIRCNNRIPTGNGLGSSSTAIVGGILLARDLLSESGFNFPDDDALFRIATALEGHADNVAPALFGGFTVCWSSEDDVQRFASFEPMRGLAVLVVPANEELITKDARKLLPKDVSHADAAFNVAHAGLLAASIVGGRPEFLKEALHDKLHEPYRSEEISDLVEIENILLEAGCDGVAISGSGPTVIGLVSCASDEKAYERAVRIAARAEAGVRALTTRRPPLPLEIARKGSKRLGL